ncbi:hypothetical protein KFU94_60355 [Chloroflexi bacterium TSY]|nr:hypothetical protein [Chloroflexi bacterium TSY]
MHVLFYYIDTCDVAGVALADQLQVGPGMIVLHTSQPHVGNTIGIENSNVGKSLNWNASVNQPWIKLNQTSGQTPASLEISIDRANLPLGSYDGTIEFISPDLPEERVIVPIHVDVAPASTYLPLIQR